MSNSTRTALAVIHRNVAYSRLARLAGALLTSSSLITAASAQDATWLASPPTGSYSSASNWTPNTVPTGTATFDTSTMTTITNVTGTVQQWNFSATASNYALNVSGAFSFTGTGITVGNGQQQINVNSGAQLDFRNSSSAGSLSAPTASVSITVNGGGNVAFRDTSTSGAANINVQNGGNVRFLDSSSGPTGSGTINNQGGTVTWENNSSSGNLLLQNSGNMFWRDNSTAGTNTIITSGFVAFAESSRAGSATISISATGSLGFSGDSTADSAHVTSSGSIGFSGNARAGNAQITSQGTLSFRDTTSADHASILNSGSVAGGSRVIFTDSSTAGNATITRDSSSAVDTRVDFFDTSSAGSATIDTTRTTATRSSVLFSQSATAGNATITSNGNVQFVDDSSAGSATINFSRLDNFSVTSFADNATAANARIRSNGGAIAFFDASSAGSATISLTGSGNVQFQATSTAGNATITAQTGAISFSGTTTAANSHLILADALSSLSFLTSSTAANAVIDNAGRVTFSGNATGGNAAITNIGNATTNFSSSTGPAGNGALTAGSIAGSGTFTIGARSLTVGGNNASTEVTGVIAGTTGTLTKVGTGTLILSGINTYTGVTTISAGTLQLGNGGTTGSILGDVIDNSIFAVNRSDIYQFDGAISGTGTFRQNGTGITILTAANTYGGGTTINAGTLQLGNGGTSGSILGNVVDNGILAINRSDTYGFDGVISGTGALQQNGPGITILTAANTYGGGTTINAGTLQLGNGGTSGSILGNVVDNGILAINRSDTYQFGGVISGTGALQQNGPGTTILTAANIYTGGTTISAGTLQLGNGGPSGSILGNVVDNGILAINRSNTYQFDGAISGTGALQQNGPGTTILTAANTYTGGTTISAGTLQLGNGGTSGSILGNVVDDGILAINRSNTYQFDGAISGTGTFRQNGAGTTILTAANTYTGGTTINAGTLQLGNGGTSGSILGNVVDNGILAINRSNTYQFDGVISGTGALQQNGPGTTILTATSTYTGATTVNAGTLAVNGSIASSRGVDVNTGGIIGGTGTLPTTRINAGGTLSPGNSIGTVTIAGGLTFVGAGNYVVEVSPTAADRTNVIGGASLAGTIRVVPTGGRYVLGTRFVVLNATSGVTGTFGTVDFAGGAPFRPTVSYDANNVYVTLDPGSISPFLQGATVNQRNLASALDASFQRAIPPDQFLSLFGLSGTGLGGALNQLSGEIATGAATAGFQDMGQFLSLMLDPFLENRSGGSATGVGGPALSFAQESAETDRLPDAMSAYAKMVTKAPPMVRYEPRWTTWGAAYGANGSFDGNATIGSHDLTVRNGGFAGGIDYRLSPNSVIGVSATGSTLSYGLDSGLGSGRGEAFKAGLYASTRFDNAYLSASAAYGHYDFSTTRNVFLPGFGERLTADVDADSFAGRIEAGYRFGVGLSSGITPYAAFQAQSFRTDGYSEVGSLGVGGLALTYASRTFDETRGELGARFDSRLAVNGNSVFLLRGRLAWAHEFSGDPSIAAAFQALPGAAFTVTGTGFTQDALLVSIGPEIRFAGGWSVRAKFDGEFSGSTQVYAGTGMVRFAW